MFTVMEKKLDLVNENLLKTNELLAKIEENLRVPDVVTWARALQEIRYEIAIKKD